MTAAAEITALHTRIQRCTHALSETAAYWEHARPGSPPGEEARAAFEERWFGAKSSERVKVLLANFRARYAAIPPALAVLRRWAGMTPDVRRLVSHWHLQLTDPLYRTFTGVYLADRREHGHAVVDYPTARQWVKAQDPGRWGPASHAQFAGKLLSAAAEVGLVTPAPDPRRIVLPPVDDMALCYLLHLLREVSFDGSLTANPYLASVGLTGGFLDRRLQGLACLTYRRMAGMEEFVWRHPSLEAWA